MTYDPAKHHRRSIRLQGYDYRRAGAYFVTLATQDRAGLFGEVVDSTMYPNEAGRMVQMVWEDLPVFYPGVDVDAFVVMPNHVHGIIVLTNVPPVGAAPRGRPPHDNAAPNPVVKCDGPGQARGPAPTGDPETRLALGDVVQRFKMMTTKRYIDGVKLADWPAFRGRLWQRNYYEHIIRDERALDRIRGYINANPSRWPFDDENPERVAPGPN